MACRITWTTYKEKRDRMQESGHVKGSQIQGTKEEIA